MNEVISDMLLTVSGAIIGYSLSKVYVWMWRKYDLRSKV